MPIDSAIHENPEKQGNVMFGSIVIKLKLFLSQILLGTQTLQPTSDVNRYYF